MNSRRKQFSAYFMLVAASLLLVVYVVYRMVYNYPKLQDLAPLALEGHGKLLVLAAQRLGIQVNVVGEEVGVLDQIGWQLVYPEER